MRGGLGVPGSPAPLNGTMTPMNSSKTPDSVADQKPGYGKPIHPVCEIFPLMDEAALSSLAADIRANGLHHPIVLHEEHIVDGRNRVLACHRANVTPQFVEWIDIYKGEKSIAAWIWSENVERRHLTREQIAFAIVARKGIEQKEEARRRQAAGKSADGIAGGRGNVKENLPPDPGGRFSAPSPQSSASRHYSGETRVLLAKEAGVSKNLIQRAINVQKVAPDLVKAVAQGAVTVRDAEAKITSAPTFNSAPAPVPSSASAAASAPVPAGSDDTRVGKRQQILNTAAKNQMVGVLSQIRGLCKTLAKVNVANAGAGCDDTERITWADIAREAAKELRLFSSRLARNTTE